MLFYSLIIPITCYFMLNTLALVSSTAANVCIKMYDIVEASIENHRGTWIAGTGILMVCYCYLWSTTW